MGYLSLYLSNCFKQLCLESSHGLRVNYGQLIPLSITRNQLGLTGKS